MTNTKLLSFLLALCMILSLLSGAVWAAATEDDGIMPLTTVDDHTTATQRNFSTGIFCAK